MAAEISKPDFSFQWASGGAIVAPSDVKIQTGWTAEVPPFQWENFAQNRQDNAILHLFQKGISEWDAASNYYFTTSGVRSYVQGSDGLVYVAVADSLNQNPVTDTSNTYWEIAFPTQGRLIRRTVYTNVAGVQRISVDGAASTTTGATTFTTHPKTSFTKYKLHSGGGGGGGAGATGAGQSAAGGGGGAGGYCEGVVSGALSAIAVTVGAGGAGGVAGFTVGSTGGSSSLGSVATATGGGGGLGGAGIGAFPAITSAGAGGLGSSASILNSRGTAGGVAFSLAATVTFSGGGGSSVVGGGGPPRGTSGTGDSSSTIGAGGAGGMSLASVAGGNAGGAGGAGMIIIEEYSI